METTRKCSVNYEGVVVKNISNDVMVLGEGPFWDSQKQTLYFVDILQHRVYRFKNDQLEFLQFGKAKIKFYYRRARNNNQRNPLFFLENNFLLISN